MNLNRSDGICPFSPGDKVECVDASGTSLRPRGVYAISDVSDCPVCPGGVRVDSGPSPTDVGCGWWRHTRFRPLRPTDPALVERIRRCRPPAPSGPAPTPNRTPELEDA